MAARVGERGGSGVGVGVAGGGEEGGGGDGGGLGREEGGVGGALFFGEDGAVGGGDGASRVVFGPSADDAGRLEAAVALAAACDSNSSASPCTEITRRAAHVVNTSSASSELIGDVAACPALGSAASPNDLSD